MRKPNPKELKVLEKFAGTPEEWGRFAGAGEDTRESLLAEGWIRPTTDPDYDPTCYEITPEGEEAASL
jgi:hypothetical protein